MSCGSRRALDFASLLRVRGRARLRRRRHRASAAVCQESSKPGGIVRISYDPEWYDRRLACDLSLSRRPRLYPRRPSGPVALPPGSPGARRPRARSAPRARCVGPARRRWGPLGAALAHACAAPGCDGGPTRARPLSTHPAAPGPAACAAAGAGKPLKNGRNHLGSAPCAECPPPAQRAPWRPWVFWGWLRCLVALRGAWLRGVQRARRAAAGVGTRSLISPSPPPAAPPAACSPCLTGAQTALHRRGNPPAAPLRTRLATCPWERNAVPYPPRARSSRIASHARRSQIQLAPAA
jgi:hypothetical protein